MFVVPSFACKDDFCKFESKITHVNACRLALEDSRAIKDTYNGMRQAQIIRRMPWIHVPVAISHFVQESISIDCRHRTQVHHISDVAE